MSDRAQIMRPLMERGVSYDQALRRVTLADTLHDQGEAVMEAVVGTREYLCNQLDGLHPEDRDHPAYKDCVPKLERAWAAYHESVMEAQWIVEPRKA